MTRRFPLAAVLLFFTFCAVPAWGQYGPRALVAPGDPVPAQLLAAEGGPAGRELAPLIGRRPVLVTYWRPGEGLSERALIGAIEARDRSAGEVVVFPVAVLAASQGPESIGTRLTQMGLAELAPRQDGGQLATILGVRRTPSFALIDAGGVLRLVGGGDVQQNGPEGVTIEQALALASRGSRVPTLGNLPSRPVYRLLGANLPEVSGTELDGTTWRKVSSLIQPGKKLLIFYWSPTCPHCKRALPKLRQWFVTTRPDDLVIVDIARADSPYLSREVPGLIGEYPWNHILDKDRSISRSLLVRETPSSYLVSSQGKILGIRVGEGVDWAGWLGGK